MAKMITSNKDLRKLLKEAAHYAWTFEMSRSNHIKGRRLTDGKIVFMSSSPSDWRALANIRRDLELPFTKH